VSPLLLLVGGGLTLAAIAAILWPALRAGRTPDRASFDIRVYKDQLQEVERDRERGLIGAEEARAAQLEIERRLLKAAEAVASEAAAGAPGGRKWAVTAALLLPVFALLLYLRLGAPDLSDQPLAARAPAPTEPDVAQMVARLEARLQAVPDDAEGWLMLGRSKGVLGDAPASVTAYRRSLALRPEDPRAMVGLAEALTLAAGGVVTPEAQALFERVASLASGEPRAGYYLGVAASQAGDLHAAIERWRAILAANPTDAPWRPAVEAALRQAARDLGIDPAPILAGVPGTPPAAEPGLSAEAARIAALPPEERNRRIREMVDGLAARLEADGGDLAGWVRLARARTVLGEQALAQTAWEKALALAPDDPEVVKGYAGSLLEPPAPGQDLPTVPASAETLYEKALTLQPDDPEPLWYLGVRALQEGRPAVARERWQRLLAKLDPSHPDYAEISRHLRRLEGS
jgi:cytochrome c-type biogenesis protein CcmH